MEIIDIGPLYPVSNEDLSENDGECLLDVNVAQRCTKTVSYRQMFAVYATLWEVFATVGLPHHPFFRFLEDRAPLLLQEFNDLRYLSVLRDE